MHATNLERLRVAQNMSTVIPTVTGLSTEVIVCCTTVVLHAPGSPTVVLRITSPKFSYVCDYVLHHYGLAKLFYRQNRCIYWCR